MTTRTRPSMLAEIRAALLLETEAAGWVIVPDPNAIIAAVDGRGRSFQLTAAADGTRVFQGSNGTDFVMLRVGAAAPLALVLRTFTDWGVIG